MGAIALAVTGLMIGLFFGAVFGFTEELFPVYTKIAFMIIMGGLALSMTATAPAVASTLSLPLHGGVFIGTIIGIPVGRAIACEMLEEM
jgi:hypothetical protein